MELDRFTRAYAHLKDNIGLFKDADLERFPCSDLDTNSAWLTQVGLAAELGRWFQLLCLRPDLRWPSAKRCTGGPGSPQVARPLRPANHAAGA